MMFTGINSRSGSESELFLISKVIGDTSESIGESPVREIEGIDRAPPLVYKYVPLLSDKKSGSKQYIIGLNVENELAIYNLDCGISTPVQKTKIISTEISDF